MIRFKAHQQSACRAFACLAVLALPATTLAQSAPASSAQTPTTQIPAADSTEVEPRGTASEAASSEEPVEVTVVGTQVQKTAGSAQIIGSKELEQKEYDDPHAVLQAVPGVYSRGEDGVGLRPNISLRGVNPDRSKKVALLEDGVLFAPAPYSAPAAYYFPLMTRITQLRVIKGPAAISYGPQTIAGAVDLVTRPIPSETRSALDLAVGEFGYGKAHGYFGSSDESTGFLLEGVHLQNDGFKTLPNAADTGFSRNEWMFKAAYTPDPRSPLGNQLQLKLSYSDEISNETYLGLSDADFREDPFQRYAVSQLDQMRNYRTSFVLTHSIEPTANFRITNTAYRHDFFRIWRKVNAFRGADLSQVLRNPDSPRNEVYSAILQGELDASGPGEAILIGPNQREFVSEGVQTLLELHGNTGPLAHRAEYGLRIHHDSVARRHSEDAFLAVNGQLVPEGSPTTVTASNGASATALALHAIDAITFQDLTLTPGLRFETMRLTAIDHTTGVEQGRLAHVLLPGAGAFYALTEEFGVLAGAYRGFSPPAPGSEESTAPELSINYETGVRFGYKSSRADVIGFYNDYENLTDVCTFSSGCLDQDLDRQFDAGEAHIYGLEFYATHEFHAGPVQFPVSAAYTLTYAEFQNSFQSEDPIFGDVSAGDELPYVPRHQGNLSVGAETAQLGGNVGVHYTSRVREEAGSEPLSEALTTDEAFLLDAGAFYRIFKPLTLYLNVRNVLDAHYVAARRPFGARPNAPRWVQLGAKIAF